MILNLASLEVEKLKVLSFIDSQDINCVSYGPFDNGHILLGLSDGWLLAYEYPSLERVESKQIFWDDEEDSGAESRMMSQIGDTADETKDYENEESAIIIGTENNEQTNVSQEETKAVSSMDNRSIVSIVMDPTNLILTCSRGGKVVALTPFERRHNYFYLELGEESFVTIGLPSARAKAIGRETTTAYD